MKYRFVGHCWGCNSYSTYNPETNIIIYKDAMLFFCAACMDRIKSGKICVHCAHYKVKAQNHLSGECSKVGGEEKPKWSQWCRYFNLINAAPSFKFLVYPDNDQLEEGQ